MEKWFRFQHRIICVIIITEMKQDEEGHGQEGQDEEGQDEEGHDEEG